MKATEFLNEGLLDNLVARHKANTAGRASEFDGLSKDAKIQYYTRQPQIQKLSDVARQMWEREVMGVMSANSTRGQGMTISDEEYQQRLDQFVEKNIINRKMSELPKEDLDRVKNAVTNVLKAKNNNDKRAMDEAFDDMISVGTVARIASAAPQTAGPETPSSPNKTPPASRTQAMSQVQDAFQGAAGVTPRNLQAVGAALQSIAGTNQLRSTGDLVADAVLQSLGFRV